MDSFSGLMMAICCGLALCVSGVAPAQTPAAGADSGTSILKWKDGKKAAFYLAFDDACPTHVTNVIPELQKRKIVGTFYPIAGNPMFRGKPQWEAAAKTPYVVLANHTLNHKDFPTIEKFEQEIVAANAILNELTPDAKPKRLISFGKPGGVKYGISDAQIAEVLARHDLIDRLPFWGAVLHVKTVDDMNKYVDQAIAKGELSHLDFHGVGGDWLVTPVDFFHAVLDKLEASRDVLWIADAATLQKYAAERKGAKVQVVEQSDTQIRLALTTTTDPILYDEPLTLATKVPAAWKSVSVTQGETTNSVPVVDGIAKYDALPGGVQIVLTPGK